MRDRKQLRQHIRAGRDWLGEADASLEHENDVRGNLRLMLAQADLQRAKEALPRAVWKRWGMRLLPLMVAMILFMGALWLHSVIHIGEGGSPTESASSHAPANPMETRQESATAAEDQPVFEEGKKPIPPISEEITVPSEPAGEAMLPIREEIRPREAGTAPEISKEESGNTSNVPTENMQKLMQSAGKVLRAE